MRRLRLLVPAVLAAATIGCYESAVPLDPAPLVPIEATLRGTWRCLPSNGSADESPVTMVVDVPKERTYAVTWQESGAGAEHYEAYGSSVRLPRLLNVHQTDPGPQGKWTFVRYELIRPSVLQLQVVDHDALAGVPVTPAALRAAIERQRASPKLLVDFCVCVRANAK